MVAAVGAAVSDRANAYGATDLATQIFVALGEWVTGNHVPCDYNGMDAGAEYVVVMEWLMKWKAQRPDWYHTFMHKVYDNVW